MYLSSKKKQRKENKVLNVQRQNGSQSNKKGLMKSKSPFEWFLIHLNCENEITREKAQENKGKRLKKTRETRKEKESRRRKTIVIVPICQQGILVNRKNTIKLSAERRKDQKKTILGNLVLYFTSSIEMK